MIPFNDELSIEGLRIACVRCGVELNKHTIAQSILYKTAPSCPDCVREVTDEVAKDMPMWPSGWYGRAFIDDAGYWWTYVMPSEGQQGG